MTRLEDWIPYVARTVSVFVLALMAVEWVRTRRLARRAESEARGRGAECFAQTGGARLDGFNATVPFAALVATPERLSLVVFGREHVFEKAQVRSLSRYRGFLSTGLRIEHLRPDAPSFVVFWTGGFAQLARELERFGYAVTV